MDAPPKLEPARFPFHHGRLALSFAGTVGDRGSLKTERLGTRDSLGRWLHEAQLCPEDVAPSAAVHRRALRLRDAVGRAVQAVFAGGAPAEDDVASINDVARRWAPRPQLDPKTLTLEPWTRHPAEAALGRVAVDAIELLADPQERSRLRACALDTCQAIFLTPPGRRERRWCSMARCGNRAKVAAFRSRSTNAG